jgi:hypothetical protein
MRKAIASLALAAGLVLGGPRTRPAIGRSDRRLPDRRDLQ